MSDYVREVDVEAMGEGREDLSDVARSNHKGEANAEVGEGATDQEDRIVGGQAHRRGLTKNMAPAIQ